jgi:hypothetical protein
MITIMEGATLLVWTGETVTPAIAKHDFQAEELHFGWDDGLLTIVSAEDAVGHVTSLGVGEEQ